MPPVIVWALGAAGAAVAARLIAREWRRVNAELDRVRAASVNEADRRQAVKLARDPATGIYRPR